MGEVCGLSVVCKSNEFCYRGAICEGCHDYCKSEHDVDGCMQNYCPEYYKDISHRPVATRETADTTTETTTGTTPQQNIGHRDLTRTDGMLIGVGVLVICLLGITISVLRKLSRSHMGGSGNGSTATVESPSHGEGVSSTPIQVADLETETLRDNPESSEVIQRSGGEYESIAKTQTQRKSIQHCIGCIYHPVNTGNHASEPPLSVENIPAFQSDDGGYQADTRKKVHAQPRGGAKKNERKVSNKRNKERGKKDGRSMETPFNGDDAKECLLRGSDGAEIMRLPTEYSAQVAQVSEGLPEKRVIAPEPLDGVPPVMFQTLPSISAPSTASGFGIHQEGTGARPKYTDNTHGGLQSMNYRRITGDSDSILDSKNSFLHAGMKSDRNYGSKEHRMPFGKEVKSNEEVPDTPAESVAVEVDPDQEAVLAVSETSSSGSDGSSRTTISLHSDPPSSSDSGVDEVNTAIEVVGPHSETHT